MCPNACIQAFGSNHQFYNQNYWSDDGAHETCDLVRLVRFSLCALLCALCVPLCALCSALIVLPLPGHLAGHPGLVRSLVRNNSVTRVPGPNRCLDVPGPNRCLDGYFGRFREGLWRNLLDQADRIDEHACLPGLT